MDSFILKLLDLGLKDIFIFLLSPLIISVYTIIKNILYRNSIKLELKNVEKIRNLLISLSMRLHFLDSTICLVLRRHNGGLWSNGKSMQKFSLYESLSINHSLSSMSNYLDNCNISKFAIFFNRNLYIDIIPVIELKNFFLYDILIKENIKYIVLSKIKNGKDLNGLLIILLNDSPYYSKSEFNKIKLLSEEIGKLF